MADRPFAGRIPRSDIGDAFPADLVEALGPALLGESRSTTAALVAVYLLGLAAERGGTRVHPSAIDRAVDALERAIAPDARRWCEDEARRVATWCVEEQEPTPPMVEPERAVMVDADREARLAVIAWAVEHELDVELEWYDETEERWPRARATPVRVAEVDGEYLVMVRTALAEIAIPVANLRWLMPVERREDPAPRIARVLQFSRTTEEE